MIFISYSLKWDQWAVFSQSYISFIRDCRQFFTVISTVTFFATYTQVRRITCAIVTIKCQNMTHAYTIRLKPRTASKLFENPESVTHISQLDETRLSSSGHRAFTSPRSFRRWVFFFFFSFFFQRWLECKSSEKDTGPIVHGSVHGNGDRERERERERERAKGGRVEQKGVTRSKKSQKERTSSGCFFQPEGEKWRESGRVWRCMWGDLPRQLQLALTLLCYVSLRTSKYTFLQRDSKIRIESSVCNVPHLQQSCRFLCARRILCYSRVIRSTRIQWGISDITDVKCHVSFLSIWIVEKKKLLI